jgi:hypothetical protein
MGVWHGTKIKHEIHTEARKRTLRLGYKVQGYAKQLCPIDTGLAMNSLQTVEVVDGVLVGSDITKFRETAVTMAIVATGGVVFYLPYIEKGHVLRNGQWWEGFHFLQKALDKVRQENGAL